MQNRKFKEISMDEWVDNTKIENKMQEMLNQTTHFSLEIIKLSKLCHCDQTKEQMDDKKD